MEGMKLKRVDENERRTATGFANFWEGVDGRIGGERSGHGWGGRGGHVLVGVTWEGGKG